MKKIKDSTFQKIISSILDFDTESRPDFLKLCDLLWKIFYNDQYCNKIQKDKLKICEYFDDSRKYTKDFKFCYFIDSSKERYLSHFKDCSPEGFIIKMLPRDKYKYFMLCDFSKGLPNGPGGQFFVDLQKVNMKNFFVEIRKILKITRQILTTIQSLFKKSIHYTKESELINMFKEITLLFKEFDWNGIVLSDFTNFVYETKNNKHGLFFQKVNKILCLANYKNDLLEEKQGMQFRFNEKMELNSIYFGEISKSECTNGDLLKNDCKLIKVEKEAKNHENLKSFIIDPYNFEYEDNQPELCMNIKVRDENEEEKKEENDE